LSVKFAAAKVKVLAGNWRQFHQRSDFLTEHAEKSAPTARCKSRHITTNPRRKGFVSALREVARHTRLPIVLYSIPGRCGIEIGVDTSSDWRGNAQISSYQGSRRNPIG